VTLSDPTGMPVDEQLERVHWHIVRSDHLRAGAASRATAVLSTNALVTAGIALAFSLGDQKSNSAFQVMALAVLGCVVSSVSHTTFALVTIRDWRPQFAGQGTSAPFFCCLAECLGTETLEDFRRKVTTALYRRTPRICAVRALAVRTAARVQLPEAPCIRYGSWT
jgi:hypothetical protein